ncbi:MAG: carboxylating nicotinate-nucleotide diphosphorylase [Oscillospiraceae bacterium]
MMQFYIDDLIKTAILEDVNYVDMASDYLLEDDMTAKAKFVSKADGVLCGLDVSLRVFELLGDFRFERLKKDGDRLQKGDVIATVEGSAKLLLNGERTALNLIQHMSGIATMTAENVELVKGTKASVTDTRKTLPGLRALQKYAVVCGGGKNHRFNLSDAAMLKDNHIDAAGGITKAVEKLKSKVGHTVKIEVETRNMDEVSEALSSGADIIMLDNMDCDMMKAAVDFVAGRALLEASGNITCETISDVAQTGVDIISIGALTHSVKAFDISLKIIKNI